MLKTSIERYGKKLAKESKLEGIREEKFKTAAALLNKKMPLKEIEEITGLSLQDIKSLKK